MRFLLGAAAAVWLIAQALAAPGGHLVEGISDECDTINPIWVAGLRGMPEARTVANGVLSIRSIDNGDDDYPSAEDMTTTYADQIGRALDASAGPSVVAWIWLPPFDQWPTGVNASSFREWFGVRVTAFDSALSTTGGFYFPGIYLATDDAGPCLIARVGDGYAPDATIGRIAISGWWTLGVSWNGAGVTEYYAAPGRVGLTSDDLLHVTPDFSEPSANRSIDQLIGNFIALRMTYPPTGQLSPDWRMDNFRVFVRQAPTLPVLTATANEGRIEFEASAGSTGFRFLLQRSEALVDWRTVADYVSDGTKLNFSEAATGGGFYRMARP